MPAATCIVEKVSSTNAWKTHLHLVTDTQKICSPPHLHTVHSAREDRYSLQSLHQTSFSCDRTSQTFLSEIRFFKKYIRGGNSQCRSTNDDLTNRNVDDILRQKSLEFLLRAIMLELQVDKHGITGMMLVGERKYSRQAKNKQLLD